MTEKLSSTSAFRIKNFSLRDKPFQFKLLLISSLAFLVRILYVFFVEKGDPLNGDAFYYHHASQLLVDGLGFTEPYRYMFGGEQELLFVDNPSSLPVTPNRDLPVGHVEPTAGHPPLWVIVLAFPIFLGFKSIFIQQLFSSLLGAIGVFAVGWAAREVAGERTGLVAAGLASIYAFLWLNDGLLMSETLVVLIVALLIGSSRRLYSSNSIVSFIVFAVIGGLAALTRAELIVALPFLALPILLNSSQTLKRRLLNYSAVGLIVALIIMPWIVRNFIQFEEPVLLSNGSGILIAQTNCDATYFGDKQGYWEYMCGLPQPLGPDGEATDESVRDKEYRKRGIDYASEHKGQLFRSVIPKRIARLWGFYAPIEQLRADKLVEGRSFRLSVLGIIQYYALLPFSILGIVTVRKEKGFLLPLVTIPVITTLLAAMTMGTTRYRVSSEVSIIILAAIGMHAFMKMYKKMNLGNMTNRAHFSNKEEN